MRIVAVALDVETTSVISFINAAWSPAWVFLRRPKIWGS